MTSPTEPGTFDRLAAPYDRGMAPLERLWLRDMRARLLPHAQGETLELGVGTGTNFSLYPDSVRLTAVDESADMLAFAALRASALGFPVWLCQANVECLPFPAGAFDTVLACLVLCSVVNVRQALAEMRRVLRKPTGRLLLLEHTRPHVRALAWLTDVANIPWYAIQGRCHLNRETTQAVAASGFRIEHSESKTGGLLRLIVARPA